MSLKTNITITICLNTNRFGKDFSVYSFQQLCFHIIFGGLLVYGFNRFQIWGNSFEKDLLVSFLTRCFGRLFARCLSGVLFGEYLRQSLWKTVLVHNPWGAEAGNKIR
jgi:hypothetical protein